jgi:hypothetical protein
MPRRAPSPTGAVGTDSPPPLSSGRGDSSTLLASVDRERDFSPSFPIHGKSFLIVIDDKQLKQFAASAALMAKRGAINVSSMPPDLFLDRLRAEGANAVHEFDMVLLSIPVDGVGRHLTELVMEDGLKFSQHMSKQLESADVDIPCVAVVRQNRDGTDVLDGSFSFVLHEPLDVSALESLISREELFTQMGVDLNVGVGNAGTAHDHDSAVQREERKRLLTRSSEMHRLRDSDDSVARMAGLVQWATLEGITVPSTPHPDALPYWQQGNVEL